MKNFRAVYDTKAIKNIKYDFKAKDIDSANEYAKSKFDLDVVENFRIIENA